MNIHIFLGPSLELSEAQSLLNATYLPPAQQGSVYRSCLEKPDAIGLIDGFFDQVPAVSHKEILWALASGIHVFGSSSMGALRAAELEVFGMKGIGQVFRDFRDNQLQDDDEVAILHTPSEGGHKPLSRALVDIRATLSSACSAGILSRDEKELLVRAAKEIFYPLRTYSTVLDMAIKKGFSTSTAQTLHTFLLNNRVEQKKLDAIELLKHLAAQSEALTEPLKTHFLFEHTEIWEELRRRASSDCRQEATAGDF